MKVGSTFQCTTSMMKYISLSCRVCFAKNVDKDTCPHETVLPFFS